MRDRTRAKRRALATIVGLVLVAVLAGAAQAEVLVGKGIAGVNLGDTQTKVEHLFGKGKLCSSFGGGTSCDYSRVLQGRVSIKRSHVIDLWTGSCKQSTAKGIHPGCGSKKGSSLQQIKRAYRGIKCEVIGGFASCTTNSRLGGRKVNTSFLIKAASFGVPEIEIGYVA